MNSLWRCLLLCALFLAGGARAHGLDAGQVGMQLEGDRLTLVATPPARALAAFDSDGDGRLSIVELQQQRQTIAQALDQLLVIRDDRGASPALTLSDVIIPTADKEQIPLPATHIKIIRKYRFAQAPAGLRLETDLAARSGSALVVMFKADGQALQSAVLAPGQTSLRLGPEEAGAWQVFRHWLRIGVGHILAGADHLLFLGLLVWGARQWRQAVVWLTAFTLGHSLTLLLVLSGVLLFPAWAEAAIAASIVITGLHRLHGLRQPLPAFSDRSYGQALLVLLFGLVHGLGFAGAVADTALLTAQRWPTLAGFNLGIEAGQLLVALLLWPLLSRLRRAPAWLSQALLASATGLGLFWLLVRL